MLALPLIFLATATSAVPLISNFCSGHPGPRPIHERLHQGLVLASEPEDLGPSYEDWELEMTEASWKVAFFDDGYMDDGQTFRFITTFPSTVSELDLGVHNVDLVGLVEEREAWLHLLRDSKALVSSSSIPWVEANKDRSSIRLKGMNDIVSRTYLGIADRQSQTQIAQMLPSYISSTKKQTPTLPVNHLNRSL